MSLSRSDRVLLTLPKALVAIAAILVGLISLIDHLMAGFDPTLSYYLFTELSVIAGGLALLTTTIVPLTWPYWLGVGLAGAAGAAGGLLVRREQIGCMFCYSQSRGYPFRWLGRGISYEEHLPLPAARAYLEANAEAAPWRIDAAAALVNVFVWAGAALAVVMLVRAGTALLRRRTTPGPAPAE